MSKSANVLSVQTLKDFKLAMINFAEEARNSLSGVDMELRRMRDWLERDQLGYWQSQIKKRQEELDAGASRPAQAQDLPARERRRLRRRAERGVAGSHAPARESPRRRSRWSSG